MKRIVRGWRRSWRCLRGSTETALLVEHSKYRGQLTLHAEQRFSRRVVTHRRGRFNHLRALFQLLLRTRDRESFRIQELLDAKDRVDLALRVEPLAAAAF